MRKTTFTFTIKKTSYTRILIFMLILLVLAFSINFVFPDEGRSDSLVYADETTGGAAGNTSESALLAPYDEKLPEYKDLKEQNEDFVGWLAVKGTKVDYPVMQSDYDPHFYLYKDFNKNYLYEGTLFIDNSDMNEPSDVIYIYGHNMKNGNQFGEFDLFLDQEYLKENNEVILDSLEERREFEITHVLRVRVNVPEGDPFPYYEYANFEDEENFDEFVAQCEEYEIYDTGATLEYGDKFVMMTTCEYTWADGTGRLVLLGREAQEPEVTTPEAVEPAEDVKTTPWGLIIGIAVLLIAIISALIIYNKRKRKTQNPF